MPRKLQNPPDMDAGRHLRRASMRRRSALCWLAAGATLLAHNGIQAQVSYPEMPIKVVVPFSAGGPADVLARIVMQQASIELGQPVVIDNRPGMGSVLGGEIVARSRPDGYTIGVVSAAHSINATLNKRLPYDTDRDFVPIAMIGKLGAVLVARPDIKAANIAEFLALGRSSPVPFSYGSAGAGSAAHLMAAEFARRARIQATHVPYKGVTQAVTDVIGGRMDFMFLGPDFLPTMRQAKLKILAFSTHQRNPGTPETPTLNEADLPGFDIATWFGVVGPRGLSTEIVDRLNAAINKALDTEAVARRMEAMYVEKMRLGVAATSAFIDEETNKWASIVKLSGATAE